MDRSKIRPAMFQAEVKYDFTKVELIEIIRKHVGFPDGIVEFDISNKGQFRGVSIKVQRSEIQG